MPIKPHRGGGLSYNYLLRKANYCYQTNSDPTVNNDGVDTAGIGRRFRVEDTWQNTTSDDFWIVRDITTGAAVWEKYALAHGATGNFVVSNGTLWGPSINTWACAATDIVGEALVNTTAATVGTTAQYSPIFKLGGTAYKSDAPAASQTQDWGLRVVPTTGTTSTTSILHFLWSNNGAAYSSVGQLSSGGSLTLTGSATATYFFANGGAASMYMYAGSRSTGLGTSGHFDLAGSTLPLVLLHRDRADSASNVVVASCYDRNAASITNAATMRIHSFGWTNNADVYNELAYVRADGAIVSASGSFQSGLVPTGISNDYGISTVNNTDRLSLWSVCASADGNTSISAVADVNAASINADHNIFSVGWVNDSDTHTPLWNFVGAGGLISRRAWGVGQTTVSGLALVNTTAAVVGGTQQYSPSLYLAGRGSISGGGEEESGWSVRTALTEYATHPDSSLEFLTSRDGTTFQRQAYLRKYGDNTTADNGHFYALRFSATGTNSYLACQNFFISSDDQNTGLSTTFNIRTTTNNYPIVLLNTSKTDAASGVVIASVYDRNAASITNAATMRIHSFGWTNNADTYTELAAVYADGHIENTTSMRAGTYMQIRGGECIWDYSDRSNGLGNTVHFYTNRTVGFSSYITDAASAKVAYTCYDVNAASITNAATMRIHSFGWTNNSDVYNELAYVRADGAFLAASGSLLLGIMPTGLSNDFGISTVNTTDTLSLWGVRANGPSNVSAAIVADVNNSTIDPSHKVFSAQWVNSSDTATELAYINGVGTVAAASGNTTLGVVPSGVTGDYGIATTSTGDTLSLWGVRSSGSGQVSVTAVADVNAAAIDSNHKAFQVGWVDNSDAFTELMSVSDGALQLTSLASAKVLSTEVNNPSVTAVTLGTENVFTLPCVASGLNAPRATLVSVVNGSPGNEKFAVDVTGNTCMNKGENGQSACFKSLTELLTITTGTSYTDTTAAIIPSGCICYAVSTKPITPILSGITYDVGVSGATTRYGTKLSAAAGTSWRGTDDGPRFYSADAPIRITPSTTLGAAGTTRVTIHYVEIDAPTS